MCSGSSPSRAIGGNWRSPCEASSRMSTRSRRLHPRRLADDDMAQRFSRRQTTGAVRRRRWSTWDDGGRGRPGWLGAVRDAETLSVRSVAAFSSWVGGSDNAGNGCGTGAVAPRQALDMAGQNNEALRVKLRRSPPTEDGAGSPRPRPQHVEAPQLLPLGHWQVWQDGNRLNGLALASRRHRPRHLQTRPTTAPDAANA